MALILVCATLDRDTLTLLKCVKQSNTICDIILSPRKTGISVQTSTDSLRRNSRDVVGKPTEIRPIHGPACCSKNASGIARLVVSR